MLPESSFTEVSERLRSLQNALQTRRLPVLIASAVDCVHLLRLVKCDQPVSPLALNLSKMPFGDHSPSNGGGGVHAEKAGDAEEIDPGFHHIPTNRTVSTASAV